LANSSGKGEIRLMGLEAADPIERKLNENEPTKKLGMEENFGPKIAYNLLGQPSSLN
jgi:hypothetical protein